MKKKNKKRENEKMKKKKEKGEKGKMENRKKEITEKTKRGKKGGAETTKNGPLLSGEYWRAALECVAYLGCTVPFLDVHYSLRN